MGGRKYFCDYCEVLIQNNPHIIRKHNEGLPHQKNRNSHYEKYKSLKEILATEKTKLPCKRVATNSCAFGALCRFSHYSQADLQLMEEQIREMESLEEKFFDENSVEKFLQRNKISKELYSEMPPSTKEWKMEKLEESDLKTEWG